MLNYVQYPRGGHIESKDCKYSLGAPDIDIVLYTLQ